MKDPERALRMGHDPEKGRACRCSECWPFNCESDAGWRWLNHKRVSPVVEEVRLRELAEQKEQ
jgi:hypothetical protein